MNRAAIISALKQFFAGQSEVISAYLFGSVARDEAKTGSDIDVAVLRARVGTGFDALPLALEAAVERVVKHPTQVVDLRTAPVDLVHRVLRDGILLCDKDPSQRIRFEVDARNRYFDLLPYLQEYRRGGGVAA